MNRRQVQYDIKSEAAAWVDKVKKFAKHPETQIIVRSDMPKPWEYLEKKYTDLQDVLSNIIAYKNTNTAFCKKLGMPRSAGGLFVVPASAILLFYVKDMPDEVILVHEMLHYCSQRMGSRFLSEDAEETFAYIESIPYLIERGYDKHWIAQTFLLPYYLKREEENLFKGRRRKVLTKTEQQILILITLDKCKALVDRKIDCNLSSESGDDEEFDRFSML